MTNNTNNKLSGKQENTIPIAGLINLQILYEIKLIIDENKKQEITIDKLLERTTERIGLNFNLNDSSKYNPINSASLFSFLYSILVVPKQLNEKNGLVIFNKFTIDETKYLEIIKGAEKIDGKADLFRYLRNSIAHVNYKIEDDDFTVELWNYNPKKNLLI
jgi:hypothetical protein